MESAPRPVLVVMARWWADDRVKTRLAEGIGAAAAREVYRRMVEAAWAGFADPGLARHLHVAPPEETAEADAWLPGADRVRGQVAGDLGARMEAALSGGFASGAPWAAVVGTDAPAVDAAMVLAAGARLADHDLAMVPSLDGGYALLAMREPQPTLFREVPWSTPEVAKVTRTRAKAAGLRLAMLPPVRDLDDAADLEALRAEGLLPAG
jgi:rSAM/selenodomain-associated transferase 1